MSLGTYFIAWFMFGIIWTSDSILLSYPIIYVINRYTFRVHDIGMAVYGDISMANNALGTFITSYRVIWDLRVTLFFSGIEYEWKLLPHYRILRSVTSSWQHYILLLIRRNIHVSLLTLITYSILSMKYESTKYLGNTESYLSSTNNTHWKACVFIYIYRERERGYG